MMDFKVLPFQQLPWARPDWQGAPQGAAMWRGMAPQMAAFPGKGRPMMNTMPQQAQGQPMQGGMNPLDMWNMIKQGRPIT